MSTLCTKPPVLFPLQIYHPMPSQERNHQRQAWCHGVPWRRSLVFCAWDRPNDTYKAWAQEATASDPDHTFSM